MAQLAEAAEYVLRHSEEYRELSRVLVGVPPDGRPSEIEGAPFEYRSEEYRYFLDKNLQLLHVRLHEMWRYRVRVVSVFVSAAIACTICILLNADVIAILLGTTSAGLFGGVLSWLTRDIIAVVEANRR
jgi:hypothetical protein